MPGRCGLGSDQGWISEAAAGHLGHWPLTAATETSGGLFAAAFRLGFEMGR